MKDAFIFIDGGFLSKLNKYFGRGKYITYDIVKFSELLCNKQNFECKKIFYYIAPPFQSNLPSKEERERKDKYDSFKNKLLQNQKLTIREGRCQKLINNKENVIYSQKAVDPLMVIDLITLPIKNKEIKEIILIACDRDFVPVVNELKNLGIQTILYTYFTKRRKTNFSRSNDLISSAYKYSLLSKQDFDNALLNKKEVK